VHAYFAAANHPGPDTYSPQLNPDEQVWKHVKERVAKQTASDKYQLRGLVREALERLQKLPSIIAGFFRHPECGFVK
jgi:transposase